MRWNFKNAQKLLTTNGIVSTNDVILKGHHMASKYFWHPGFAAISNDKLTFVYTHVEDWAIIQKSDIKDLSVLIKGNKIFAEFVWVTYSDKKIKLRLKLGENTPEVAVMAFEELKNN